MRQHRIVLADDNPELLHYATRLLAIEFSDVVAVSDGESVLQICETSEPDVVILDISMGEMSGFEVARRLLDRGQPAKIVFLTVHEEQEFLRAAFGAGGTAYVVKPRLDSDLLEAVNAVLSGHMFISSSLLHA